MQKRDWAHEVDINKPMTNFHELVPEMAHKVQYPFELDTFQKEAVYHLEMGDSVFVAAHTSVMQCPLTYSQSNLYISNKSTIKSEVPRLQADLFIIFCRYIDGRRPNQSGG